MKLIEDYRAVRERDPAARGPLTTILLYSGFHAVALHRLAHLVYRCHLVFVARAISQVARFLTGVEIHPAANIGGGLFIDHGTGVVIGETAELGRGCTLYQGVTLGGTGKDRGKRHPTLGDNVMVGAGAKILGPFTVGSDSKIAAGAVVLSAIPPGSTAVGVPARVVRRGGQKLDNLDHVHLPDPVSQELCAMRAELAKLKKEISALASPVQPGNAAEGASERLVPGDGEKLDNLDQAGPPDPVSQELCALRVELAKLQKEVAALRNTPPGEGTK